MRNIIECRDFLLIVAAIFLPPLAVYLETGVHSEFYLNILLTLLGWIPGLFLFRCSKNSLND